jgi:hypothetical protein
VPLRCPQSGQSTAFPNLLQHNARLYFQGEPHVHTSEWFMFWT